MRNFYIIFICNLFIAQTSGGAELRHLWSIKRTGFGFSCLAVVVFLFCFFVLSLWYALFFGLKTFPGISDRLISRNVGGLSGTKRCPGKAFLVVNVRKSVPHGTLLWKVSCTLRQFKALNVSGQSSLAQFQKLCCQFWVTEKTESAPCAHTALSVIKVLKA